jgi:hypothetical protein
LNQTAHDSAKASAVAAAASARARTGSRGAARAKRSRAAACTKTAAPAAASADARWTRSGRSPTGISATARPRNGTSGCPGECETPRSAAAATNSGESSQPIAGEALSA